MSDDSGLSSSPSGGTFSLVNKPEQQVVDFIARCGVTESKIQQLDVLGELYEDLLETNSRTNLTRITDPSDYWVRHIADSLSIGLEMPEIISSRLSVADVGCGAGFPILPLAWGNPALEITGVEPKGRKADFVATEIERLGFKGADVRNVQAREYEGEHDYILLRAVGNPGRMVRDCRRFLRQGGRIVFYKTPASFDSDLPVIQRESDRFGFSLIETTEFELPCEGGRRRFLVLEKDG